MARNHPTVAGQGTPGGLPAAVGRAPPSESDHVFTTQRMNDSKQFRPKLETLTLVVTRRCNLACDYCVNGRWRTGSMDWAVARAAIDLLLQHGHPMPEIRFYGGEPILEFELIRRSATYLKEMAPSGTDPRLHLTTNGTLIDDEILRWLAEADVSVLLSSDGVVAAQQYRSRDSFLKIDGLIRRTRDQYPEYFERRLAIQMTLTSSNLPLLSGIGCIFLRSRSQRNQDLPNHDA